MAEAAGIDELGIQVVKNGKIVDTVPSNAIKNFQTGQTGYKYTDDEGITRYTNNPLDVPTSVTIDKETGNIKISAPKAVTSSDWFKTQFLENENLQKLSQAYKLNEKYAYETTDENGNTVYKTAEELVGEYDAGLKKAVESMQQLYSERDRVLRPVYGDKVDKMSLEDIRTALTPTYNVGDIKVSNSTVISLPDFLLNHPIFGKQIKALGTFNADEGTVQRGDFMDNFWNRNKNPELTAERIQGLYQNMGTTLNFSSWDDVVEDDYERHGSNQAAREIAFRNFIQGQDPSADFLMTATDTVTSVLGGIGKGLADWSLGMMNMFEFAGGKINSLIGGQETQGIRKITEEWDNWKQYDAEQLQLISDTAATWNGLSEAVTELGANIYTGNLAGGIVSAGLGAVGGSAMQLFNINKAGTLGRTISAFALALESTKDAGDIIKASIGAQKVFSAGGALAGSIVNITTQAVVDAALTDPVLFRKAVDGDGGDEAYNYLTEQFAWNVGGFAVGLGLGKLALEAADTKVGRAINAKWAKGNAKLKTIGYNVSDGIKAKISHRSLEDVIAQQDEVAKSATKTERDLYKVQSMRTAEQLDTLKAETRAFAKADIDIFDGLKISDEGLEEAEKYITNIKSLQNAIDAENRSIRLFVEGYDDVQVNPEMAGFNKAMKGDYDNYRKIENKVVSSTGQTFTRMQGSGFSQEAANYIGARIELRYMETVLGDPESFAKSTVESATKNIGSYRDAIEGYTKKFGSEWAESLNKYVEDGRKWYGSMNSYRASKGLTNAQDLEDLRNSALFKDGDYMRVQRKTDKRYKEVILEDGTKHTNINIEFQHLEFSEMSDFMAPDTVQALYKINTANAERNLGVLKTRLSVKSAFKETLVSGEETQLVKNLKATKSEFNKAIDAHVEKFTKSDSALFDPAQIKVEYDNMVARATKESKLASEINKTKKGIEKTATKAYRVNDVDRVIAAQTLAPTDVTDILVSSGKSQTGSILQDGLDQYAGDPQGFNRWYQSLPDESKQTINRVRRDYNDYVGLLPKSVDEYVPIDIDTVTRPRTAEEIADWRERQIARGQMEPESAVRQPARIEGDTRGVVDERINITGPYITDTSNTGPAMSRMTRNNLETLISVDPNLEDTINLQVLKADKKLLKTDRITQMAEEAKRVDDNFIRRSVLKSQRDELVKVVGEREADSFVDEIVDFSDRAIDSYITSIKKDPNTKKFARTIAEQTGDSEDDVIEYLALSALEKKQSEVNKQIRAAFGSADKEAAHIGKQVENAFDNLLTNYVDSIMGRMSDSDLVSGEFFERVKKLNNQIENVSGMARDDFSNVIVTTDTEGRKVFMQVDPVIAKLYKTNIGNLQMPASGMDKLNKLLSKTFRLGTTGVNLSSTMRQWFRDSGNAFSMGGAFRKIQSCSDELIEDWGERIVQQLDDYDATQLARRAEETGQDIKKLAVERELRMGEIVAGQTTEVTLYRESLTKAKQLQDNVRGVRQKIDDIMNGKRENYLRNRVYANNLLQAMNNGKTLDEARVIAEFAMNNATTNFSRKLVHLQRVADSAPYLSAAINGTKSFWRIATLDPVGVTTRIMAGFVVPQMYFTASSLADEENRKVYENLPEYTKSDNLVFVQNGTAITIPIPQELSFIIDPFRQFVEGVYGANKNNFWELAANDILGAMPIDLSGFTAVDMDDLVSDPTIFDRVGRGVSRVFSQVAPVPIKSAYMMATGIDPYSGKRLRDKSWVVWNDDTGDYETMDYNQGSFAKLVASAFGDNANVTIAEKVLSGVFGNTGMDVADTLISTFQKFALGDENADPLAGVESQIGRVGSSLTGEDYSMLNSEWQRTIAQLEEERNAILNSKEMQDIQSKLGQDIDENTRAKMIAKRKDLLADWQKKVASITTRLAEQGGTLDRYKFAAVVQLLNMNSVNGWVPENKYLQNLTSQNYYAGRNEAYRTMKALGIDGVSDYSIFGYIKYKDGKPSIVYNTPTSIVTAENLLLSAKDVDKANIDAIIKSNDLYTQREEMYNQTNAIYNKSKLTSSDYNAIDAIKMAYNNKVLAAIVPYLEKVSPEAITNNEQVMDVLENLIQVPSAYEKVNNRFVSSGGGKLNKQQGFVRSYIKAVLNKEKM